MSIDRGIDHLVLCVNDLDQARAFYQRLGFTCTPPALHPWGTGNTLIQLQGNFIELLAILDPAKLLPPAAGQFDFGRFNADYLKKRQGFAMLVFQSKDARHDHTEFKTSGLDTYAPFDFERQAKLPDGTSARVAFSLAFVTHQQIPEAAFFCCQQHAPQYFWKPEYQKHPNGAKVVSEVVMRAPEPGRFTDFFAKLQGKDAVHASTGRLDVRTALGSVTLLDPARIVDRFPDMALPGPTDSPILVGYRVAVADIAATEKLLRANNVLARRHRGALVVDPSDAFGVAIEFAQD